MIATKEDVLAVAPCFSSLTDEQWTTHLRLVAGVVSDDAWGDDDRARLPQSLFAAHHLAMVFPVLAAGGFLVSAETVGHLSRTYVVPSLSPSALNLTRWGAQYMALVRSIPAFFAG